MSPVFLRQTVVLTKLSICALPAEGYIDTNLDKRLQCTIFRVMVISINFKKLLHRRTFKKRLFPSVLATPEDEQDQSLPVPL
jgi:hypothetical protein